MLADVRFLSANTHIVSRIKQTIHGVEISIEKFKLGTFMCLEITNSVWRLNIGIYFQLFRLIASKNILAILNRILVKKLPVL